MARKNKSDRVKLGLVQMSCGNDPAANLAKAIERIEAAAKNGAQIICLQELFRSRYFCQSEDQRNFKLAETIPGPGTDKLSELARRKGIVIVASLFERRAAGIYHNTAVVIDADGKLAGKYRKMHIPDDPLYYEKFYFTPGDLGFPSFSRYGANSALSQKLSHQLSPIEFRSQLKSPNSHILSQLQISVAISNDEGLSTIEFRHA